MPGSADAGNGIGGTADRVKVLSSCAIANNSITSAHIIDGSIVNADINASAAIALSKLASCPLARSGHTGTQAASTISDFDTEVANNTAVAANTAKISYCSTASTKLATIETSATADQSNAEIVAAVEAGTDSNTFTDTDHSKLDAIEASATADQSAGEIKTAYESNACTNALTCALSAEITANTAKISYSCAASTAVAANTAKISYCSTASTKLGTIEGSATADQSNAEIKTAYEANACTNALTCALSGEITANTAKISYCSTASTKLATIATCANNYTHTTNANLTGDVTSTGNATTIAAGAVDLAMLSATGTAGGSTFLRGDNAWSVVDASPLTTKGDVYTFDTGNQRLAVGSNGEVLKACSSTATGLVWGTGGGGATSLHSYTANTQTTVFTVSGQSIAYDVGTTVATQAAGVGTRDVYIRKIDTNNEGVFTIIHKNGALVEVQIG